VAGQLDTIIFVGSGVSAWSGLPTWPQLISELADFLRSLGISSRLVERELEQGDLLQAASYGFDQLSASERRDFLRKACRVDSARPSTLHRRLATLDPRCFITTNYDELLEQALLAERTGMRFQSVSNTDPVEEANIIQTHARDFVFKPHGSIDAVESVVITREDYRQLQDHRNSTFDALKTLLASRPVIFVGFGLRDPDFLFVKDTLAIIYGGAAQDHYALVPDVTEDEFSYWRRHYGIHLLSYPTDPDASGPADTHAALATLLDDIASAPQWDDGGAPPSARANETLAVLRHLKRLQQIELPAEGDLIPLEAIPVRSFETNRGWDPSLALFERTDAATGLARAPKSVILTGPPGAGKTVVVRSAMVQLAEQGIERLLDEQGADDQLVPVYIDMRTYAGELWQMVVESFPVDFPLDAYVESGRILFFLDGLNEVPAAPREDNSFRLDLHAFLARIGNCKAVLVTRFRGENEDLELPELELDSIPEEYLESRIAEIAPGEEKPPAEVRFLLRRPVFFRFFQEHDFPLKARTPHTLYEEVLEDAREAVSQEFTVEVELTGVFGELAFSLLDAGEQLMPVEQVLSRLAAATGQEVDRTALLNWLIERRLLIAAPGSRVTFFHHSITEYMAGFELARRYRSEPNVLRHCLRQRHWDHAVLLALGFLDPALQHRFFGEVFEADPVTGLRALAFIEADQAKWTEEALRRLIGLTLPFDSAMRVAATLARVSVDTEHIPTLLELSEQGNELGGTAMSRVLQLQGPESARTGIDSLFEHGDDYNFQTTVARALERLVDANDLQYMLERLSRHPVSESQVATLEGSEEVRELTGLLASASILLEAVDLEEAARLVGPVDGAAVLTRHTILERAGESGSATGFRITTGALPEHAAIVALYFQLSFRNPTPKTLASIDPKSTGPMLVDALRSSSADWAVGCLRKFAELSEHWRAWLSERSTAGTTSIELALLQYGACRDEEFFATLAELVRLPTDWDVSATNGLSQCTEVNWEGHEALLFELLALKDKALAYPLLESVSDFSSSRETFRGFGLGNPAEWVEWLAELGSEDDDSFFVCDRLGRFIADTSSQEDRRALVALLDEGSPAVKKVLAYNVLDRLADLRAEELSDEAIAWLVEDLRHANPTSSSRRSVLAVIATEALMENTIVPLFGEADELLKQNIVNLAEDVGRRHGRRYLTADGDSVI
jgi:MoxR-like ATPase